MYIKVYQTLKWSKTQTNKIESNDKQTLYIKLIFNHHFHNLFLQHQKKTHQDINSSLKEEISKHNKATSFNDTLSLKIGNYLRKNYLDEADLRSISTEQRKFQFSTIDLNSDGVDEIFVYLNSNYFCGSGGCTFLLLDKTLNLITKFTVTKTPILISNEIENYWKKLYLFSNGGYREMIYNARYRSYPSNPSMEKIIIEDLYNHQGVTKLFGSEKQTSIYY